jgi:hypothetical protein
LLPDAEELIAHLDHCDACRRRLDELDDLPPEIADLRIAWRQTLEVDLSTICSRCAPCLPQWRSRGEYVELEGGPRLKASREPPYVAVLDRFLVAGLLGRGGMGCVLEGFDPRLRRSVALKVLKPDLVANPDMRDRLLSEARAAADLQHPHVVIVYDVCVDEDPAFLVLEHVRGRSLGSLILAERRLSAARAARLCIEVLSALRYAHGRGFVHRDIKPSNILLDARIDMAKVVDFGLACRVGAALGAADAPTFEGTPCYMSPEQTVDSSACDGRSDLFSLGVVLFEMVTGCRPFTGSTNQEIVDAVCRRPAPDPRQLCQEVPETAARIIDRALRKHRADRYQSADEFTQALQDFLDAQRQAAEATTETGPRGGATGAPPGVLQALLDMTQPHAPFRARVWIDRQTFPHTRDILTVARDSRDCCRIGEQFALRVQANVDCYVTLIDVGTTGRVSVLLQNHPIRAGAPVALDGPDDRREWVVGGPTGIEQIKALFTRQPLVLSSSTAPWGEPAALEDTRDILARIRCAGARLQEMPADAWTDATCRFLIESA